MKKVFRLVGLDCANCAAKIEKDVQKLKGVQKASVSLMTTRMVIEADDDKIEEITKLATAIVNKYEPDVLVKRG